MTKTLRFVVALLVAVASATLLAFIFALLHSHWSGRSYWINSRQNGLNQIIAFVSLFSGLVIGIVAFLRTQLSPSFREQFPARYSSLLRLTPRYTTWTWIMWVVLSLFAFRAFCWLTLFDGDQIKTLSPYQLADLSCHTLYSNYFANGVSWWPDNPLHAWSSLRYYPGIDLFQSLLILCGGNQWMILAWVGLIAAFALGVTLERWGGAFVIAGFLFNGGFEIIQWIKKGAPLAAVMQSEIEWKSFALTLFVPQRGFLFGLPVGLLLLACWRTRWELAKANADANAVVNEPMLQQPAAVAVTPAQPQRHPFLRSLFSFHQKPLEAVGNTAVLLPFWIEALLYIALPMFHLFTFLFLSLLIGWWILIEFRRPILRNHFLKLIAISFIPATLQVALMTNGFSGHRSFWISWGWLQGQHPFWYFWILNFGLMLPLAAALWLWVSWQRYFSPLVNRRSKSSSTTNRFVDAAFVIPAGLLFLATCVVMVAPWQWDNIKLMLWSYLIVLPFLYNCWIRYWPAILRWPTTIVLFASGFVAILCGMNFIQPKTGTYGWTSRTELYATQEAVENLNVTERFACAPDYSHPLILCGRKIAMGYIGTLSSHGLDYQELEKTVNSLMLGEPGWEQKADKLGVRYIYWSAREQKRYPNSKRPWERATLPNGKRYELVANLEGIKIYDLGPPKTN